MYYKQAPDLLPFYFSYYFLSFAHTATDWLEKIFYFVSSTQPATDWLEKIPYFLSSTHPATDWLEEILYFVSSTHRLCLKNEDDILHLKWKCRLHMTVCFTFLQGISPASQIIQRHCA